MPNEMLETFDPSAEQTSQQSIGIAEEILEDAVKLSVELAFLILGTREEEVKVRLNTVEDAVKNTRSAIENGASDDQLRFIINNHDSTQSIAQNNPEKLEQHQNMIISEAQTQVELQEDQIEIQETQIQEYVIQPEQSQNQNLGY